MKLEKIINITGTIHLVTGLHIGAGKDSIEIGGLDLPIIKNPRTKAPYIPGSSIKGKMRSLLEVTQLMGQSEIKPDINVKGEPCGCTECLVCTLFGTHNVKAKKNDDKDSNDKSEIRPTRLLFRDALLTKSFANKLKNENLPMEVKYENTINRVTGTADNPRPVERVPAGVEFTLNIAIKIFEGDDEEEFKEIIKTGLRLIELDALGGHSSRGSGQVKFDLTCGEEKFDLETVKF